MKKYFTITCLCFFVIGVKAQTGINENTPWQFIKGDSLGADLSPIYGIQGFITEGNIPGARKESMTWTDSSGNLWLFGGEGLGVLNRGFLNDLWKYDRFLNQWIYIKGDNIPNMIGVYGILGIADNDNKPGARRSGVTWIDSTGKLWLFGGYGYYTSSLGKLNDLWKYDPVTNQWTWMNGDNSKNVPPTYGTIDKPQASNNPGGRDRSTGWIDHSGKLWLFGGSNDPYDGFNISLNDLWKYDPSSNQWTWVKGDDTINVQGIYGAQGKISPNNKPGSRTGSASWIDDSDNLWLFGGYSYYSVGEGWFNDLWKYSIKTNQWTWVKGDTANTTLENYGTENIPDSTNKPGGRSEPVSWKDNSGNLWLFGGYGYGYMSGGYLNDLWKYNTTSNEWTWMSAENTANNIGLFGTKRLASVDNTPGGLTGSVGWADKSGGLWLLGGHGNDASGDGEFNALWKYNLTNSQWAWMKGDSTINITGIYGQQGYVSDGNRPGPRREGTSWKDALGNLWMFGGNDGNYTTNSFLNDVWKYNPLINQWTSVKGDDTRNVTAVYPGIKGIAGILNNPGARRNNISWVDSLGNFWVFGGEGYYLATGYGEFNDLWKYSPLTNQWTWMSGDSTFQSIGVYGTIGKPSLNNKPGGRSRAISWIDNSGNLWLFGGEGYDSNGNFGVLNDLWEYDPITNQWTWINGNNIINSSGTYEKKGTFTSENVPGGRSAGISWKDKLGNFWLFGGKGIDINGTIGLLNDLWEYNTTTKQWAWVNGDSIVNIIGIYGVKTIATATNKPGAKYGSVSWTDDFGKLWLFGGSNGDPNNPSYDHFFNDLWQYDISTNQWKWMSGDSTVDGQASSGVKNVASISNKPMSKRNCVSWIDNAGNFWLFGGIGNSYWGNLDDLWKYDPSDNEWTWVKGTTSYTDQGVDGLQGIAASSNEAGARALACSWTDTIGNLWLFGGEVIYQTSLHRLNDLWKFNPISSQWTWMKGDSLPDGTGIYGEKGIEGAINTPRARAGSVSWIDDSGKLWLFGGESSVQTWLNDLWKYNPVNDQWVWVAGDSIGNTLPVYGIKDSGATTNNPGARERSASWKDNKGNLWLFGGASNNYNTYFNDLWKYNIALNQWTWVNGDSTSNNLGIYGNKGVVSPNNRPGARRESVTWTDSSGNLWLFGGGIPTGSLNDLWKYDPVINQWTWVGGDSVQNAYGYYNSPGLPDTLNMPGARGGASSWKDVYGNIFIFGGGGYSTYGNGILNDLWKYNPSSKEWTFFNGKDLNTQSTADWPGGRYQTAHWTDYYGDFWLFGGYGQGSSGGGHMNDLWKMTSGTQYTFTGNGDWDTASNWVNDLVPPTTITAGMDVTIDHLIPGECVNHGPITVQPRGRIKVESGKQLTIDQGSLINEGNIIGPGNRPGQVNFTGIDSSALRSSGSISTPLILSSKNMYLSGNSTTSAIYLSGNSKMKLDSFNLNMDTATLVGDSANFIITNGTGTISRKLDSGAVTFYIGTDSNSYAPITILRLNARPGLLNRPGDSSGTTTSKDSISVRVAPGIQSVPTNPTKSIPITGNSVNHTWFVDSTIYNDTNLVVTMQWKTSDEDSGFDRNHCYISNFVSCPPILKNCKDGYYDKQSYRPATVIGPNTFSLSRKGVNNGGAFIVTSMIAVYSFTGSGDWDNSNNWSNGIVGPKTIASGVEVIINPSAGGQCTVNGDINIQLGGALTVQPGQVLNIIGKIIVNKNDQ